MEDVQKRLDKLAEEFDLPSITTWKQGEFLDSRQYAHMPDSWKEENRQRERTLIRPHGGTHNALFQVTGSGRDDDIVAYLVAVGELLADTINS